jgi:hypothetical protein
MEAMQPALQALDAYFKITVRGSTLWTEFRAGTVSFLTLCYISQALPFLPLTLRPTIATPCANKAQEQSACC